MSSVHYRSESPYVPRAIEHAEKRASAAGFDFGALRVLIIGPQQFNARGEIYLAKIANALCDSGHIVDLIADSRAPALDGRVRLVKLQDAVRAKAPAGFGRLLDALSARAKAERRLAACLAHIVSERASDYELVIDNQTLLDQVFAFRTRGVKVLGLITAPHTIERSARKTVRSLDGVLVPSPGIAEEVIHELGTPRTAIEILDDAHIASTVSRLYARIATRRG